MAKKRTDNHGSKLKAFSNALSMYLIGEVGKTDITHQFFSDDIGYDWGGGSCQTVGGDIAVAGGWVRVRHLEERKENIRMGEGRTGRGEGGYF